MLSTDTFTAKQGTFLQIFLGGLSFTSVTSHPDPKSATVYFFLFLFIYFFFV